MLTGTIFHGTKIPIRTWLFVILEMCSPKNSVSAREIERKYDLTLKTARFMLHRICEAMKPGTPLGGLPGGAVQLDETWIGGDPKNRHRNDPREGMRASSTSDKQPVMALVHVRDARGTLARHSRRHRSVVTARDCRGHGPGANAPAHQLIDGLHRRRGPVRC